MHVTAMRARYIGKGTDRKWEQGEDFSLLAFKPTEFDDLGKIVKADPTLIEQLAALPIKEIARKANVDRNTIRKITRGFPLDLPPEKAMSAASITKAFLSQMNITAPANKFDLPDEILSKCTQAFYGGRAVRFISDTRNYLLLSAIRRRNTPLSQFF